MKKFLHVILYIVTALCVGFVNGFFGGGGGMLLVPLLIYLAKLPEKQAHATAIPIILPVSIASGITYAVQGIFSLSAFIPTTLGVVCGGVVGALLLKKLPPFVTSIVFSLLMIVAGVRMFI